MRRVLLGLTVLVMLGGAAAWSGSQIVPGSFRFQLENKNPVTNVDLNNDPNTFQFAIVSDRTGGHRPQVFARAVEQLNLLQPEFVVSVGDLIEGYTQDRQKLGAEWRELQSFVSKLRMPFFYVAGNHDIANAIQEQAWIEKFGRRHYHFAYRNVLFLMLNSEDPPGKDDGAISADQVYWVKQTLDANKDTRWVFLFMHKPMWTLDRGTSNGFGEVEKLLAGRSYTVFAGHEHRFVKFNRFGQDYYLLATTGGVSRMRGVEYGEFDHVVWVTMKKNNPVVANILVDGILPENLQPLDNKEAGSPEYNRRPTQAVSGVVTFRGKPVSGATVTFHPADKQSTGVEADGVTDEAGRYKLSTYSANDGAPVGSYKVTVEKRQPMFESTGTLSPNTLPGRYGRPATTPLNVNVSRGGGQFNFDLEQQAGAVP